jgi:quercetin dioxygenase-like cupin family protein
MFALVDLEPGALVPNHSHPHEQAGLVLEGELEFEIGGERRTLKAGDVYTIPGDVKHSARALAQKARVLDVFTPTREEYKY